MRILAVVVDLDATSLTMIGICISSVVTFFVLFDRIRRDLKYIKGRLLKERRARKALTKLCMAVRYDQSRIMHGMEHPIEPSKLDDSAIYEAVAAEFAGDELLPSDDDDDEGD